LTRRRSLPVFTYEQADWSVSCQEETLCRYPAHPLWGIIAVSGALMGGDNDGSQVVDQSA
jgi:hypothetical protein